MNRYLPAATQELSSAGDCAFGSHPGKHPNLAVSPVRRHAAVSLMSVMRFVPLFPQNINHLCRGQVWGVYERVAARIHIASWAVSLGVASYYVQNNNKYFPIRDAVLIQ
jgi:hypothetical protein